MAKRKSSFDKRIVICGVLVALSVIIMYLGSAIEVLDLTMSAIVSLLVVVIVIEMGYSYAWLAYFATSILALLLLYQKSPAIFYFCFMGYYPILKSYVERIGSGVLRWIIKLVIGNAAIAFMVATVLAFINWGFVKIEDYSDFTGGMLIVTYALGLAAFIMYDVALTKLITLYFRMIRDRLKIYKLMK